MPAGHEKEDMLPLVSWKHPPQHVVKPIQSPVAICPLTVVVGIIVTPVGSDTGILMMDGAGVAKAGATNLNIPSENNEKYNILDKRKLKNKKRLWLACS